MEAKSESFAHAVCVTNDQVLKIEDPPEVLMLERDMILDSSPVPIYGFLLLWRPGLLLDAFHGHYIYTLLPMHSAVNAAALMTVLRILVDDGTVLICVVGLCRHRRL